MTFSSIFLALLLLWMVVVVVESAWIQTNPSSSHCCPRRRSSRSSVSWMRLNNNNNNNNNSPKNKVPNHKNRDKDRAMIDFMYQQQTRLVVKTDTTTTTATQEPPLLDPDTLHLVERIVRAADGRKAEDIICLHVESCTTLCSVLVICSGNSRPQNQAICKAIQQSVADAIVDAVDDVDDLGVVGMQQQQQQQSVVIPEGTADSGWILLDYGSVMVHIMTPKSRLFYNIPGQWIEKGAHVMMGMQQILIPNTITNNNNKVTDEEEEEEEVSIPEQDPFWS